MAEPASRALAKALAKPLSHIFVNSVTEPLARAFDTYWSVLLGKGAGTGWALDAEIKAAAFALKRPPAVIFDVGANLGEWSALFKRLYPMAKIFAFEPQPVCQAHIRSLNIPELTLIPNAVSSKPGQLLKLYSNAAGSGIASLHQRRDSFFSHMSFDAIEVATVTIDDIVRDHEIARIDFMKIDVEGHELDVFNGATESLRTGKIKALSFEFGAGNINSRTFFHDFWDVLDPLGYVIYRVLPSGRAMRIKRYYEDCEYFRGVSNYIAVLE